MSKWSWNHAIIIPKCYWIDASIVLTWSTNDAKRIPKRCQHNFQRMPKLFSNYVINFSRKNTKSKNKHTRTILYLGHTFFEHVRFFEVHILKNNICPGWFHNFSCIRWSILVIVRRCPGPDFAKTFEVPRII